MPFALHAFAVSDAFDLAPHGVDAFSRRLGWSRDSTRMAGCCSSRIRTGANGIDA